MSQIIQKYLSTLHGVYISDQATEHSYRRALEKLFSEVTGYRVINEPKRSEYGAPDFIFQDGMFPVCYAEAKDIKVSLEKIEKSEQLSRYFGYAKLILTNGLEFRFYHNGTRYGEPIVLADLEGASLKMHENKFEYFLKHFADFLNDYVDTIRNASDLAKIMGGKSRRIRDNIKDMLTFEDEKKFAEIKQMKRVFRELLIHDLDDEKFADLYAQTLVYGLFVARYNDKTPENFSRREALELVPKSNPLLRKFFDHTAGEAFEKRIAYIVDELCNVFLHADVHALMHGLYQKRDLETHDPVIHFYEDFLKEYDSKLRMDRGVFYTPMPVVRFMVRAIDDILKKHFNLGRGLLDTSKIDVEYESQNIKYRKVQKSKKKVHRVQLLDPAVGTGTFLNEVIKFAHSKMEGQQGRWEEYVNTDLIPRLHGFELMMASYTIAHLKLGLTLSETGINDIKQRLKIYLTNSLEEGIKVQNDLLSFGLMGSLTEEAQQAGHIKSEEPIMIVLGNPPYNGESKNKGDWIMKLMKEYKKEPGGIQKLKEQNSKFINDDYVKFFRLSESLIEKRKEGILSFITNHGYIDNSTFRGMRWHLLNTFDQIYIIDLHGSTKKLETTKDGKADGKIFGIEPGVSMFFGVKTGKKKKGELGQVLHTDIFGTEKYKLECLTNNDFEDIKWEKVKLDKKYYYFCPKDFSFQKEYNNFFSINELFQQKSLGVLSKNDNLTIKHDKESLEKVIFDFLSISEEENRTKYNIKKDSRDWTLKGAIQDIKINFSDSNYKTIIYRPFDIRNTYFTGTPKGFFAYSQNRIMYNFKFENLGLIVGKQGQAIGGDQWNIATVTNIISDQNIFRRGGGTVFPLYLYSESGTFEAGDGEVEILKTPNLDETIWKKINKKVGETEPEDILDYIYAVLHSKTYREKYKEFLKIDFPKIPFPKNKTSFFALAKLGAELRSFHLLENQKVWNFITSYPIAGENIVEKIKFEDDKVYVNNSQYFGGISKEIYDFQIGGYKPVEKYLKDRKGRSLSSDEFDNYQKMIVALSETIRIMEEIEEVFEV